MLNRMAREDKSKKTASKKMVKRGKRDDSDGEESDSSVDSHGNIRDLIDYEDEDRLSGRRRASGTQIRTGKTG